MKVECPAGHWHNMLPSELLMVVDAFVQGDMQTLTDNGIATKCLYHAITPERLKEFRRKYPGSLRGYVPEWEIDAWIRT